MATSAMAVSDWPERDISLKLSREGLHPKIWLQPQDPAHLHCNLPLWGSCGLFPQQPGEAGV